MSALQRGTCRKSTIEQLAEQLAEATAQKCLRSQLVRPGQKLSCPSVTVHGQMFVRQFPLERLIQA
jgi:hypothetical protein